MRRPLAILVLIAALARIATAADAGTPNYQLPTRGPDAPLTTPLPLRLRTSATPSARVPEPGTNLARAIAAGAQIPPPAVSTSSTSSTSDGSSGMLGTRTRTTQVAAVSYKMLFAPADADNPTFRAALAALTGGTVDYFDATNGVPSLAQLSVYDCVYTYPSNPYPNATTMGDRLADFADLANKKVILGAFCTFTSGASMGGRIMTNGYAPVFSPTGTNHLTLSAYAGDGMSSLHAGVLTYASPYRDVLSLRAGCFADGHYQDGEIVAAWRADGKVIYVNGGASNGTGDWARMIANAWTGMPSAPSILYAPGDADNPTYRAAISGVSQGPVSYYDARSGTPGAALLATYDAVHTWPWSSYSDLNLMGNRLADFVDAGGRVVLGTFCTATLGPHLGGRIMTAAYSPVTNPTGNLNSNQQVTPWLGDGSACLYGGVTTLGGSLRDRAIVQGAGIADGHLVDGDFVTARRPDGRVVYVSGAGPTFQNTGDWPRLVANAVTCTLAVGPPVLYAPSDIDDPMLRAKLAARTGGPVDYFDARAGTPSLEQLLQYSAVYTWSNFAFADPVAFGNRLAAYVDRGGRVVLGPYCTYTAGNALEGAIMGPAYAPVTSPSGAIAATPSAYVGNGVTRLLHGVTTFDSQVRDILVGQGAGDFDAHYADGNIAVAYRPDRRVVYLNGGPITGSGDWEMVYANAFTAPLPSGVLYAATIDGRLVSLNLQTGTTTQVGTLPAGGANEIEIDPTTGTALYQLPEGTMAAQWIFFRTGTGIGPAIPNDGNYAGLEFALGRLYGTGAATPCSAVQLRQLNPSNGSSIAVGSTGFARIAGLAFDARRSAMYGVGSGVCGEPARLVEIRLSDAVTTTIGPPLPTLENLESLEFGPDGDLYGGSGSATVGKLYRVHPQTGAVRLIGYYSGLAPITGLALAPAAIATIEPPPSASILRLAAFPNPSRSGTVKIAFSLPMPGAATVEVFDIAGRNVWRHAAVRPAGDQALSWDGRGPDGNRVPGGVYLVRLTTAAGTRSTRVVQLD